MGCVYCKFCHRLSDQIGIQVKMEAEIEALGKVKRFVSFVDSLRHKIQ